MREQNLHGRLLYRMEVSTMLSQKKIGSRIFNLRTQKKLTQEKLAQMVSVDRTTISNWESGKVDIPFQKIQRLKLILGNFTEENNCEKETNDSQGSL